MKVRVTVKDPRYFAETLKAVKEKVGEYKLEKEKKDELWKFVQLNVGKARLIPSKMRNSTFFTTMLHSFVYRSKNVFKLVLVDHENRSIIYDADTAPAKIDDVFAPLTTLPGGKKLKEGVVRILFEGHVQMWSKARKAEGWPKGIIYIEPLKE